MTLRKRILELAGTGLGVNAIAKELKIWPYTVRYHLDLEGHRAKERKKRREEGAAEYSCGLCRTPGHTAPACPNRKKKDSSSNS